MTLLLLVLLVLAIALVAFAIYNPVMVDVVVPFLGTTTQLSLSLLVTMATALGAVALGIVGLARVLGLRVHVWNAEARGTRAEAEVERVQEQLDRVLAAASAPDASTGEQLPPAERDGPAS